mgnify:CR=1 FL=1
MAKVGDNVFQHDSSNPTANSSSIARNVAVFEVLRKKLGETTHRRSRSRLCKSLIDAMDVAFAVLPLEQTLPILVEVR